MPTDTELYKAAHNGDLSKVKQLVEGGGVEVNAPGASDRRALHRWAIGYYLSRVHRKEFVTCMVQRNRHDSLGLYLPQPNPYTIEIKEARRLCVPPDVNAYHTLCRVTSDSLLYD